ncbi:serine protease DegS [Allopseudospirillum japonicum]|uniref:Serine protease DegS n=1 Tax=Allopseudospirillum japonicum TaxID=64971 RepID=A0A1H6SX02_9GAMM|nr:serine protease DegS [Allopseudospirillum japonicum]
MKNILPPSTSVSIVLGVVIALGVLWGLPPKPASTQSAAFQEVAVPVQTRLQGMETGPVSYAQAVQEAAPAVVNIYTTKIIEEQVHPILNDPFFRQWFGYHSEPRRQQRLQSSLGSGVIVSHEGYILTNHHVIQDADEIRVALRDGRETFAHIVGVDPDTDLAVLKVDLQRLPVIRISASDQIQVGDVVLAIGNPFGVGQTVTQGIISATGRNSLGINTFEDFIQTDAAINPGNSGGALINAYGELVGINTAIFSRSGGSQGIGFAVPSNLARRTMSDIIRYGYVVRGWLGIEVQDMNAHLWRLFKIPPQEGGILVTAIVPEGPAHQAGLLPGDILLQLNGQNIENARELMNLIAGTAPTTQVKLKVLRNQAYYQAQAQIAERPHSPQEVQLHPEKQ